MIRPLTAALMLVAALVDAPAAAQAPDAATPPVVVDAAGVAIGGYDPVAYFSEGRAVTGDPAFSHRWQGATWLFASAAARDRFAAGPGAYAPRYGGWCAWAMSEDRVARGDPLVWRIVDGRLYFNCSPRAQAQWEADIAGAIARGDANWARRTGAVPAR